MKQAFRNLIRAFKIPDIRRRLLFTVGMIALFRVGGIIPVPGIDRVAFTDLVNRFGQIGAMMDIISGGALKAASIFAMGISPYITSSIIMQLLTVAIPALQRLSKEGESGRKKMQQITRYVTVGMALIQAFSFWFAARSAVTVALPPALSAILIILSFTAGTMITLWIAEQIDAHGIGNGVSMLIFIGILARVPSMVEALFVYMRIWTVTSSVLLAILYFVLVVGVFFFAFVFVNFVAVAERRIPVHYARRVVGRKQYGGQNTYLPIKVDQASVLPVIFATSIMSVPNLIISFFFADRTGWLIDWFRNPGNSPIYYLIQFLLILGFTFFYLSIQFNPVEIANNLQGNGGYIPGIRPGRPTVNYIKGVSRRLTWVNGLFLAVITLTPMLIGSLTGTSAIWFGGTAVLIISGVARDITTKLEAQLSMRSYKGFLD